MKKSAFFIALASLLVALLAGCGSTASSPPTAAIETPTTLPMKSATQVSCASTLKGGASSRIPMISFGNLQRCRPDVAKTLKNIQDGSFRYSQDDGVFENREQRLPAKPKGTYREYTVVTPGSSDRGAHRIITSGSPTRKSMDYAQLYYTDDHYDTFWLASQMP